MIIEDIEQMNLINRSDDIKDIMRRHFSRYNKHVELSDEKFYLIKGKWPFHMVRPASIDIG